jgi:hypothetical protein
MHKQVPTRAILALQVVVAFAMRMRWIIGSVGLGMNSVRAQQAPPIFENVSINSKFSPDPLTLRGISGGSVAVKQVAGRTETANGPCVGYVDEKPNHILVLSDFFNYLKIVAESPEDTTMVVRGPGGTWCNDDFEGQNPGLAGEWLPGTYRIWIGSYDKNKYPPYILRITKAH